MKLYDTLARIFTQSFDENGPEQQMTAYIHRYVRREISFTIIIENTVTSTISRMGRRKRI